METCNKLFAEALEAAPFSGFRLSQRVGCSRQFISGLALGKFRFAGPKGRRVARVLRDLLAVSFGNAEGRWGRTKLLAVFGDLGELTNRARLARAELHVQDVQNDIETMLEG